MARVRSPNYPQFSLPEAISRVGEVFQKERQHPAPKAVMVAHLGYSSLNGASIGALSALLKYGLLDREGDDYRVSDRTVAILHPHNPQEKNDALVAAAKAPALFAEVLENFKGVLPSDENLRAYLIRRGFSESAIGPVIVTLRDTLAFIADIDNAGHTGSGTGEPVQKTMQPQAAAPASMFMPATTQPKPRELRVSLTDDGLEVTAGIVDQKGIERLIKILEANKSLLPFRVPLKPSSSDDQGTDDQDVDFLET